jgi:hypothetical protein
MNAPYFMLGPARRVPPGTPFPFRDHRKIEDTGCHRCGGEMDDRRFLLCLQCRVGNGPAA